MPPLQRERVDAGIEVVRLDRPAVRNAIDTELLLALVEAFAEVAADPAVQVLVLSTTDAAAFCAGADVAEVLTPEQGVARMDAFHLLYDALESCPVVVVAVCVGNCVGAGAELVAGADLRVGGDNLKLAWAGARLGVPIGPARLVPLVGDARARELVFTSRVLGCEEADALGILTRTAPAAEAEAVALELAREVAAKPAQGVREIKRLFRVLGATADRATVEQEALDRFQREGSGLPQGAATAE